MKDIKLSLRMQQVADFVPEGFRVADIGCDHAYVSIYLCQKRNCPRVYAMDVRKGPLEIANKNIRAAGLDDQIETRLSDGMEKLAVGEVDAIVLAGMGGLLMVDILKGRPDVLANLQTMVLQPQSDIDEVRRYVHEVGFSIEQEAMLWDEGKPYWVMQATAKANQGEIAAWTDAEYAYGKLLLHNHNGALHQYLLKQRQNLEQLLGKLKKECSNKAQQRLAEVEQELSLNAEALAFWEKAPAGDQDD